MHKNNKNTYKQYKLGQLKQSFVFVQTTQHIDQGLVGTWEIRLLQLKTLSLDLS